MYLARHHVKRRQKHPVTATTAILGTLKYKRLWLQIFFMKHFNPHVTLPICMQYLYQYRWYVSDTWKCYHTREDVRDGKIGIDFNKKIALDSSVEVITIFIRWSVISWSIVRLLNSVANHNNTKSNVCLCISFYYAFLLRALSTNYVVLFIFYRSQHRSPSFEVEKKMHFLPLYNIPQPKPLLCDCSMTWTFWAQKQRRMLTNKAI